MTGLVRCSGPQSRMGYVCRTLTEPGRQCYDCREADRKAQKREAAKTTANTEALPMVDVGTRNHVAGRRIADA